MESVKLMLELNTAAQEERINTLKYKVIIVSQMIKFYILDGCLWDEDEYYHYKATSFE